MAGSIEVKVPDIGDFKEVGVIEVLVAPGDRVEKEGSLITVESDKATMEIPSPVSGVVKELKVKVGDKVAEGSLILILEQSADAGQAASPPSPAPIPAAPAAVAPTPSATPAASVPAETKPIAKPDPVPVEPQDATVSKPHASPSIRRLRPRARRGSGESAGLGAEGAHHA